MSSLIPFMFTAAKYPIPSTNWLHNFSKNYVKQYGGIVSNDNRPLREQLASCFTNIPIYVLNESNKGFILNTTNIFSDYAITFMTDEDVKRWQSNDIVTQMHFWQ